MVANTSDSTALDTRLFDLTQAPVQDSVGLSGRATDSPSPRWALLGVKVTEVPVIGSKHKLRYHVKVLKTVGNN